MMVIPIDGAVVPDVIDPYVYTTISGNNFKVEFDKFVQSRWEDVTRNFEEWNQKIKVRNTARTSLP
jgi:hypothetical protein